MEENVEDVVELEYAGIVKCKCGFEFYIESVNPQTKCLMCDEVNNIPKKI